MAKFAIVSDIHSNIAALEAVFADIDKRGIKEVFCLGDIVGYGPDPKECLDVIIERQVVTIMGNHDHAIFYEPTHFNVGAEKASYWTRQCLEDELDQNLRSRRWSFIGKLPTRLQMGNILMVHGSPRRPVNEYIFPDDIYSNSAKIITMFDRVDQLCFVGHTHVPGVFLEDPDFYSVEELDGVYPICKQEKAIINVGSVGQPRDQDTRSCYVVVDEKTVEFVRVGYDWQLTAEKIFANPNLDNFEGERLKDGR